MPRKALTVLTCLALAAGTAVAGCGDDDEDAASTPAAPPAAEEAPQASAAAGDEVAVSIKDIKFLPHDVTAEVGQKIVWTNNESIVHNVTAVDGEDFKSEGLQQGDTFDFTPTKAGKISYVCTIHTGQDGTVTVTK